MPENKDKCSIQPFHPCNKTLWLFLGANPRPCIYEPLSLSLLACCWIGSKVSDACSETPHKACSHCSSVPEISGMINSSGIPVETAVKLQRPHSILHAKIHRQPWPFCASAASGTLSSWVSKPKDQHGFCGIKHPRLPLLLPLPFFLLHPRLRGGKSENPLIGEMGKRGRGGKTNQGWNEWRAAPGWTTIGKKEREAPSLQASEAERLSFITPHSSQQGRESSWFLH